MFRTLTKLILERVRALADSVRNLCVVFRGLIRFPSGRRVVVGRLLAEGGFSFVYIGNDVATRCSFALKKIICQDDEAKVAAVAEGDIHERFQHPNLLHLVDRMEERHADNPNWRVSWFLFPLCRCSLRDEITKYVLLVDPVHTSGPSWNEASIMEIIRGICSGLQEMHRAGVSHRDIKPENVLLQNLSEGTFVGSSSVAHDESRRLPFGRPIIIDFGSCGELEVPIKGRAEALRAQEAAAQFCTVQYRAPELFDVPSNCSKLSYAKADVWALGCTFYCCLMGYSPFEVDYERQAPCRPIQVEAGHLRTLGAIPWPKAGPRSFTPESVKEHLKWILSADPAERPTVAQVLQHSWTLTSDLASA